ncbi:hypothetical protein DPEC_G00327930 [Dallia pectoralis]|uniref:Uncharacterized protein n=1 Tax=Dallia pectoralis TaxID=75939 RepID=A0ACC2F865_DALPE|nr:hypothetical protein DPEC_G00327930 [Dallia pectoralis]
MQPTVVGQNSPVTCAPVTRKPPHRENEGTEDIPGSDVSPPGTLRVKSALCEDGHNQSLISPQSASHHHLVCSQPAQLRVAHPGISPSPPDSTTTGEEKEQGGNQGAIHVTDLMAGPPSQAVVPQGSFLARN